MDHVTDKASFKAVEGFVDDAHLDELDVLKSLVNDKMVNALPLSVPVIVEINTGENWLEAH